MVQNRPADGEKMLREAQQNNPKQYAFLTALALHYALLQRRDDMIKVLEAGLQEPLQGLSAGFSHRG